MPAYIDYTGKKIGRVKILESVQRSSSRWKCLCDCGKEFICLSRSFKRGDTFECKECRFERKRGIDLTGRKCGRWNVIERRLDKNNKTVWFCRCDCGNTGLVSSYCLGRRGKSMSCGCLGRKEKSIRANTTLYPPSHLTSETNIYAIRARILQGCYNENNVAYKNYGEKGITVCELWRNSAKDFYDWCMKNGWKKDYVVHLNNGEKVFSPETCRILSPKESQREMLSKKITIHGKTLNVFEWSELSGTRHLTILDRLSKGYSEEDAVFCKSHANSGKRSDWPDEKIKELYQSGLSLADVARALHLRYTSVSKRLTFMGVEIDLSCKRRKYPDRNCIFCNKIFKVTNSNARKCETCRKIRKKIAPLV